MDDTEARRARSRSASPFGFRCITAHAGPWSPPVKSFPDKRLPPTHYSSFQPRIDNGICSVAVKLTPMVPPREWLGIGRAANWMARKCRHPKPPLALQDRAKSTVQAVSIICASRPPAHSRWRCRQVIIELCQPVGSGSRIQTPRFPVPRLTRCFRLAKCPQSLFVPNRLLVRPFRQIPLQSQPAARQYSTPCFQRQGETIDGGTAPDALRTISNRIRRRPQIPGH